MPKLCRESEQDRQRAEQGDEEERVHATGSTQPRPERNPRGGAPPMRRRRLTAGRATG
jgi:hypothetical protein